MTTPTSTAEAPHDAPTAGPSPNDIVYLNGPVIRFAMRVRGWSQAGLSRLLGVSESTLSRALRGEATTWRVVRTLLDAFDERLAVAEVAILPGISRPLPDGVRDVDLARPPRIRTWSQPLNDSGLHLKVEPAAAPTTPTTKKSGGPRVNATPLYPTYTATQFLYADVFDLAAAVNMLVNALVHQAVTRPRSLSFGVKGAMDRGHAALTADPATQSASLPYAAAKLHLSVGKLMGHGLDAVTDDVQAAYIQLGQLRRDRVSTAPQRQDGGA